MKELINTLGTYLLFRFFVLRGESTLYIFYEDVHTIPKLMYGSIIPLKEVADFMLKK